MAMDQDDAHPSLLLTAERMVTLHAKMSEAEKRELSSWEQANVTGDGTLGTSDWPGWMYMPIVTRERLNAALDAWYVGRVRPVDRKANERTTWQAISA